MEQTTGEARGWWQMFVAAIVTSTVISLAYLVGGNFRKRRRLPPGPPGWPVVGWLLSMGALPHRSLDKLSKTYGPIMFLRLGSVPTVVVSNKEMAEAVLKTNDQVFASRPSLIAADKLFYNRSGFGFAPYGHYHLSIRKICTKEFLSINHLKLFQAMREREVLAMMHSILETSKQGPLIIYEFLSDLNSDNILQMMVNKSYCAAKTNSTSAESISFRDDMKEMLALEGAFNIADYIPIFKLLDLQGLYKRMEVVHEKMDKFFDAVLLERRHAQQSLTEKQDKSIASKDFLDVLLASIVSNGPDEAEEPLPHDKIKGILLEMLASGTETSAISVEWVLAELLKNPSMLKRAQEELDFVVGKHRLVNEADIPELKYLQAIVKETFRLHPPGTLGGPRESLEDCEIGGYHIPAKVRMIINNWTIQRDPLLWERPLEFDPDRFLSSTRIVDVKGNNFELVPFGSGRRMCPGMNLGLLMVHLPLAQMLHTANWELPEDQKCEELDMSESFGLVSPRVIPLRVLATPRLSTDVIYPTYMS